MKKILRYKSDILAYISSIIMIVGTILPIVNIEGITKAFIIENGKLVLICAVVAAILYLFKLGFFSFLPSLASLFILYYFYSGVNETFQYLNQLEPGSAFYDIGFYMIIVGSILLLISSIINLFDYKKYGKKDKNIAKESNVKLEKIPSNMDNIRLADAVNLINKGDFISCPHCGATIKKDRTKCTFCDTNLVGNKM
ncbi:MAG: zinc ribbon domain-containing protein [Clostridium sp.]|nr:zinc ribbon domain-containing protein [Clostridium sp.]MCM1444740.1 zinc ribbon domain-containing protein [Candidatus Amulumruptor caecigallinarius]